MTGNPDPQALIYAAQRIASEHSMFLVAVTHKGLPAWVCYRKVAGRNLRLWRSADPETVLRKVKSTAGVAA